MSDARKASRKKHSSRSRKKEPRKDRIDTDLPSAPATEKAAEDYAAAASSPREARAASGGPEIEPVHYPKPEKAYKNLEFLNSAAARSIRVQCELAEPALRFRRHDVNHTIVLFGSARIPHPPNAARELKRIEKEIGTGKSMTREQKKSLDHARRLLRAAPYYEDAKRLSSLLTTWSLETIPRPRNRFYICSGGGPGIMEAANRGAREAGGQSVALGISLPFEQHLNSFADEHLGFEFHYFFVRKYWFFYLAKALVVFPGGFGTLDELFEMLTLIQTQKATKYVPVVLYGRKFWDEVVSFQALVEWGVISEEDLSLFQFCDSVDEARDYLVGELTKHYL